MGALNSEIQGTGHQSPERALLSEVILLAIADSLGTVSTCTKGVTRADSARQAREWLQRSPVCRHYCSLLDIDHQAMLDRLAPRWQRQKVTID